MLSFTCVHGEGIQVVLMQKSFWSPTLRSSGRHHTQTISANAIECGSIGVTTVKRQNSNIEGHTQEAYTHSLGCSMANSSPTGLEQVHRLRPALGPRLYVLSTLLIQRARLT